MTDIPREASTHLVPGSHWAGASGGGGGGAGGGNGGGGEQFALPRGSLLLAFANLDHCGAAKGNHARVFAYVEMVKADGEVYKLSESNKQRGVQSFASEEHKLDARVARHSEPQRTSTRSDCTCCFLQRVSDAH